MLESIFYSGIIYYVMVGFIIGGVISKCIASITLGRFLKEASNMSKSTHGLMKLVKAKFEHACMVNDHVENVEVFIEKYLHEYRILGLPLYGWQRARKIFGAFLGITIFLTAFYIYYAEGLTNILLQEGEGANVTGITVGLVSLFGLLCFYQIGDERYKEKTVKLYMVDYLQNVCAQKYARERMPKEKIVIPSLAELQKKEGYEEIEPEIELEPEKEELTNASCSGMKIADAEDMKITMTMVEKLLMEEADRRQEAKNKKQEESLPNESAIRQILQEFMA